VAYKLPSAEGECILYAIRAYVLTVIASVCGLQASILDFQKFEEVI
jgi:hypothetical protein